VQILFTVEILYSKFSLHQQREQNDRGCEIACLLHKKRRSKCSAFSCGAISETVLGLSVHAALAVDRQTKHTETKQHHSSGFWYRSGTH
jgi:hypothetical protein